MRLLVITLTLWMMLGCLRDPNVERAFTKPWAHQVTREAEHEARKERIREGRLPLVGRGGGVADVKMDEKGDPKLRLGKESGFSADVDVHGGEPDVKLKYKLKWKARRPKREE